jgi:hypothetical protein
MGLKSGFMALQGTENMGVLNFFLCVYIPISFKDVHFNLNINIDFRKANFDHDIMFIKETLCIFQSSVPGVTPTCWDDGLNPASHPSSQTSDVLL